MKHLAVVGGGFAGMWAALTAAREFAKAAAECRITLVSRDEYLTVRPRLYEVFTPEMRAALAPVLAPAGIELLVGNVDGIDLPHRRLQVHTGDGVARGVHFDRVVLAAGSVQRPLPVPGSNGCAFDIDTFEGARRLDEHLRDVLRDARDDTDLTCVIVGGGFTGIELAAEMRTRLRAHRADALVERARVVLVERASEIGPDLGSNPRPHVLAALTAAGVELRLGCTVRAIGPDAIELSDGTRIPTRTVIVTAGLAATPLAGTLGAPCDATGRVHVDDMLRVKGVETVFAAGDAAHALAAPGHPALMSCQHAVPMGKHAGFNAAHDLLGLPLRAYSQPNYVTCLDLGEYGALFTSGWERTPEQSGPEVKPLKRMINTQWIYPPTGDRAAILEAADLDAPWPPKT
ncbi:MAG: NAD(P)/FAD-dependent oxidoreductase [Gammaproteobacteria bacterium]